MKDKLITLAMVIFSKMPLLVSQIVGVIIGSLLYIFPNREKRIASINLQCCFPELSAKQHSKLLHKTLIENAKTLLEMPRIFKVNGSESLKKVKPGNGLDLLINAIDEKKGVIIAEPHLGNWELSVHFIKQFADITAMYAPPKQKVLNDIMHQARENTGATLVPADSTGVRAQLKVLKQGGLIAILPDQQPKGENSGIYAPFFNYDAYTMLLIHNLAKRTGATVLMSYTERLGLGKGFVHHFVKAPDNIHSDDPLVSATALNKGVENCVRHIPAQYQWTYKRFNKQAKGKDSPYKTI